MYYISAPEKNIMKRTLFFETRRRTITVAWTFFKNSKKNCKNNLYKRTSASQGGAAGGQYLPINETFC
jgi:hypothetical protein